jgi:type II secretory pathway component HofQ
VQGLPLLENIPGVNNFLSTKSKEHTHNELLIVVTPHLVRKPFHDKGSSVLWNIGP